MKRSTATSLLDDRVVADVTALFDATLSRFGLPGDDRFARSAREWDWSVGFELLAAAASAEPDERRIAARMVSATPEHRCELLAGLRLARWNRRREGSTWSGSATIVAEDQPVGDALAHLLDRVSTDLSAYADLQPDLRSVNALVRGGIVSCWAVPGAVPLVAKSSNPAKPGRFENEQAVLGEVVARLGTSRVSTGPPGSGQFDLAAVPTAASIRTSSGRCWTFSRRLDAPTMEELLISGNSDCDLLLADAGAILERLFDLGILWRDMSPRNILVDTSSPVRRYFILDFEKTTVLHGRPPTSSERAHFCRGQVGIEEFAVLAPPSSLPLVLGPAFDQTTWDTNDERLWTGEIRPDLGALLRARGVDAPTVGRCNTIDQEILSVRQPRTRDRCTWRPGQIGFRVEHYLSCAGHPTPDEVDRRVTEILLAADAAGALEPIGLLLDDASIALESASLRDDLLRIAGLPPEHTTGAVARLHDALAAAEERVGVAVCGAW